MVALAGLMLLGGMLMLQTAAVSNLRLLQGSADLVMLTLIAWYLRGSRAGGWVWAVLAGLLVGFVSGLPWPIPFIAYLATGGLTLALRNRLWGPTLLTYFVLIGVNTWLTLGITWAALNILGVNIPLSAATNLVILPSLVLNLLWALPVYAVVGEVWRWFVGDEVETTEA